MLDLSNCKGFKSHRSGWGFAIDSLMPVHSKSGVLFDDFIERTHSWNYHEYYMGGDRDIPHKRPWVGFFHIPHNCPEWWDHCHKPQTIIQREVFQESMKYCLGLFTLTDYLKNFIQDNVDVPVCKVMYPTEIPQKKWSEQKFLSNNQKRIIQLGAFLRDSYAIIYLRTNLLKAWFPGDYEFSYYYRRKMEEGSDDWGYADKKMDSQVWVPRDKLPNDVFDDYMTNNVLFAKLHDASASTAVVESIARNTPILVNRHEALEEYLGEEYPFFYDNLDHASSLINNETIIETHRYLKSLNKDWISGTYFRNSVVRKVKQWQHPQEMMD